MYDYENLFYLGSPDDFLLSGYVSPLINMTLAQEDSFQEPFIDAILISNLPEYHTLTDSRFILPTHSLTVVELEKLVNSAGIQHKWVVSRSQLVTLILENGLFFAFEHPDIYFGRLGGPAFASGALAKRSDAKQYHKEGALLSQIGIIVKSSEERLNQAMQSYASYRNLYGF